MHTFLLHFVLFLSLLTLSSSTPTKEGLNGVVPQFDHLFQPAPVPNPLKRLRNYFIEKIWSVPEKTRARHKSHPSKIPTPASFRTRYGNDVVLRFSYTSQEEARAVLNAAEVLYLDVWELTETSIDVRIAKDMVSSVLGLLPRSLRSSYQPLMPDLAQAVYDTYPGLSTEEQESVWQRHFILQQKKAVPGSPHDAFFQEYQPLSVIYPWLQLMASLFSNHATLTSVGKSAEGRDIPALRIGTQAGDTPDHDHLKRETVLITAGGHAREWISISTATYIAYTLATQYGSPRHDAVTKLLDHFDFVFIPIMNPDGYEYTWSTDRLWRKNRQQTSLSFCPGLDLDRSFPFRWDGNATADNPCSEDYAGTGPLMATEAAQLTQWAKNETENNNVTFIAYLDLHSYSQEILYPYSYSCNELPPNLETLEEVALGLAKSLRLSQGHRYSITSACEGSVTATESPEQPKTQLKAQGGSALDWFYHDLYVKYAYQIKLRDTGSYGFLLPKSNIIPTGSEAVSAVLGLGRWLLGNHGIEMYEDPASIWGVEHAIDDETTPSSEENDQQHTPDPVPAAVDDDLEFELDLRRRKRRRR